jgi:hypothetical protein
MNILAIFDPWFYFDLMVQGHPNLKWNMKLMKKDKKRNSMNKENLTTLIQI